MAIKIDLKNTLTECLKRHARIRTTSASSSQTKSRTEWQWRSLKQLKTEVSEIRLTDMIPDENVQPQIMRNYDGTDIALTDSNEFLPPNDFSALKNLSGVIL